MDLRKIDALVAEKVMGWVDIVYAVAGYGDGRNNTDEGPWYEWQGRRENKEWILTERVPPFSTNIVHAWKVVEKLTPTIIVGPTDDGSWMATYDSTGYPDCWDWVLADTAPLAICMAALRARGITTNHE